MVNINVVGRLGKDAQEITTAKGDSFLRLTVAVDEYVNGQQSTAWLNVTSNANNLKDYLTKGKLIYLTGTETISSYTDKNGATQFSRNVKANSIEFVRISSGHSEDEATASVSKTNEAVAFTTGELKVPTQSTVSVSVTPSVTVSKSVVDDDELPF